jgi:hypothetical protein
MWPACQMHTGRDCAKGTGPLSSRARARVQEFPNEISGRSDDDRKYGSGAIYIAPDVAGRDGRAVRRGGTAPRGVPRAAKLAAATSLT